MDWQKWIKAEPARLACYVQVAETAFAFESPLVDDDLLRDRRLDAVRAVYEFLAAKAIPYVQSPVDFAAHRDAEQVIRQPWQVRREGGNCLELALVFAALCQKAGLRPWIVLLERHAMVAVRLDYDVGSLSGNPGPDDWELLSGGLLPEGSDRHDKAVTLTEWQAKGRCVFIECTGMAAWRDSLSFEEATTAGLTNLTSPVKGQLTQVVDVVLLHLNENFAYKPYRGTPPPASSDRADEAVLGELAIQVIRAHTARLDAAPPEPPRWNAEGLRVMLTAVPGGSDLGVLLTGLGEVLQAAEVVRSWMPGVLTSRRLRAVLAEALPGRRPELDADATEADYLAYLFLNRPPKQPWTRSLVEFVVAVALDAGLELKNASFRAWANRLIGTVAVNDLVNEADERRGDARWRLRISLHGSLTGGWPESVTAWLFNGDKQVDAETEHCEPTQRAVETAVGDLLTWATELASDTGDKLKRIDIAVPTSLLVHWRPEETKSLSRIGLHHVVVVRWSERLGPPRHMRRMLSEASHRWEFIEQYGARDGIVWLEAEQTHDVDVVREQLATGKFRGAMGLRFRPEQRDDLLEMLLSFSPVLLWLNDDHCGWKNIKNELRVHWESPLPDALAAAYRTSWTQQERPPPLAVVRAVWDDKEWLEFCRLYLRSQTSLRRSGG